MRIAVVLWLVVSVAWIAVVAMWAVEGWPRLSLDLSPSDPGTRALLEAAERNHVLRHAGLALGPPLVVLAVAWLAGRRGNRRS